MSTIENSYSGLEFLWNNFRDIVDLSSIGITNDVSLVNFVDGVFPIDSFNPIYLEVPKNCLKMDLSGRLNCNSPDSSYTAQILREKNRRIQCLPVYKERDKSNSIINDQAFSKFLSRWREHIVFISEKIPCIALSTRSCGIYSTEGRMGQRSLVILIWPDFKARLLELEWFEGPLEDCCTPEWYMKASALMNLKKVLLEFHASLHELLWANSNYSIFCNPQYLGNHNSGELRKTNIDCWQSEWVYSDFPSMMGDLNKITSRIENIFYKVEI